MAGKAGQQAASAFKRGLLRDFTHLGSRNFYSYARVNIIREPDTPFYIMLTSEVRENLPLEIINKTQYEIRCYQKLRVNKKDSQINTIDVSLSLTLDDQYRALQERDVHLDGGV